MGCHFLLQGIFPTQGSNPGLQHCRKTLYHLSHQGNANLNISLSFRKPFHGSSLPCCCSVAQSCPTLRDPMDCSLPGSSIHGIFQARVLDSVLKSRDITLPTKAQIVKAMVFPAVMYGCESWTIKKAEHRRIEGFQLRCWKKLLRVPWTARD